MLKPFRPKYANIIKSIERQKKQQSNKEVLEESPKDKMEKFIQLIAEEKLRAPSNFKSILESWMQSNHCEGLETLRNKFNLKKPEEIISFYLHVDFIYRQTYVNDIESIINAYNKNLKTNYIILGEKEVSAIAKLLNKRIIKKPEKIIKLDESVKGLQEKVRKGKLENNNPLYNKYERSVISLLKFYFYEAIEKQNTEIEKDFIGRLTNWWELLYNKKFGHDRQKSLDFIKKRLEDAKFFKNSEAANKYDEILKKYFG